MKKITAVLLAIIIAFSFAGCTGNQLLGILGNNKPLREIDISALGEQVSIIDFDMNDRYIAMIYAVNDGNEKNEDGEEVPVFSHHIGIYDILWNTFKATAATDDFSYALEMKDDYIQVWKSGEEAYEEENAKPKSNLFDYKLRNLGDGTGDIFNSYDVAKNIDTIDTDRFSCFDSYAYESNYIGYDILIFYDDSENYFITKHDNYRDLLMTSYGKLILENVHSKGDKKDITLNVNDYENLKVINSITIESDKDYDSLGITKMDKNGVCFEVTNDNGYSDAMYYWSYNEEPFYMDLDCIVVNDSNTEITESDNFITYDTAVNNIMGNVMDKYEVNMIVDPEYKEDSTFFNYKWERSKNKADMLLCLYDFEYCMSQLPEDFCKEAMCKDMDNPICTFERYDIYFTGKLDEDEDVAAYAFNVNDSLVVVYDSTAFSYSIFFHELMHNTEYRIWNYEPDFDEEWENLNPDGFEYNEEYVDNYYDHEAYQDYFSRDYGTKNIFEDKATVFETICATTLSEEELWWKEQEPLYKKADLLYKVLVKSFPSLAKDDIFAKSFE